MKTIAEDKLIIHVDEKNQVVCSFGESNTDTADNLFSSHLYDIEDLAYYGMILGKEGMSGDHCHSYKLSTKKAG